MMSSAFEMVRKLYVIAPIWTPLILESIVASAGSGTFARIQDAGRPASVSFPKSRRERSIIASSLRWLTLCAVDVTSCGVLKESLAIICLAAGQVAAQPPPTAPAQAGRGG